MTEDEWTELINDKLAVFLKKEEKHKAITPYSSPDQPHISLSPIALYGKSKLRTSPAAYTCLSLKIPAVE